MLTVWVSLRSTSVKLTLPVALTMASPPVAAVSSIAIASAALISLKTSVMNVLKLSASAWVANTQVAEPPTPLPLTLTTQSPDPFWVTVRMLGKEPLAIRCALMLPPGLLVPS